MGSKFLYLAVFLLLIASVFSCSKEDDPGPETIAETLASDEEVYESLVVIDAAYERLLLEGQNSNGDAFVAIEAAAIWASQLDGVSETFVHDHYYLTIRYNSGLENFIRLDFKDEDGSSMHRGGGVGPGFMQERLSSVVGSGCSDIIENPKVLFYNAAYFEGVSSAIDVFEEMMCDHPYPFEVTRLEESECTPDALLAFGEYGLVIMDTHGNANSTLSGLVFSHQLDTSDTGVNLAAALVSSIGQTNYLRIRRGELLLSKKVEIEFDLIDWFNDPLVINNIGKGISMHESFIRTMTGVENTIILNNSCFSGMTLPNEDFPNPIGSAYLSRSPLVYYGWQRPDGTSLVIGDNECKIFAESFVDRLLDSDSTGIAHLQLNGDQFPSFSPQYIDDITWLEQFRSETWCYPPCQDTVMVDSRDQQSYKLACIGDQVWFAENLNWSGSGNCFNGNQNSCDTFGRLYNWSEVTGGISSTTNPSGIQGVCPNGWHVPSISEWQELINFAGGSGEAGGKLKANSPLWIDGAGTDDYGFKALPAGECSTDIDGIYDCFNEDYDANFWSTSEDAGWAGMVFIADGDWMGELTYENNSQISCRCVKD